MPRDALISRLKRIGRRELELTLAALEPIEREQILALLAKSAKAKPPSFENLASISPWLLKAVGQTDLPSGNGRAPLTEACRIVLLDALASLEEAKERRSAPKRKQASLFARFLPNRDRQVWNGRC